MRALGMLLLIALLGVVYYEWMYPPTLYKRAVEKSLRAFARTVASKDSKKIGLTLAELMTEDADVHLEVNMMVPIQTDQNQLMKQDFFKNDFMMFIDNILYTLTDYTYQNALKSFVLADDKKIAEVTFGVSGFADGKSYFAGNAVDMRFSVNGSCNASVRFDAMKALLSKLDCNVALGRAPKGDAVQQIQKDPQMLLQFLQEQK